MKKILVTGGAGFVGSHLCTQLLNDGHHVICLDNFLTGCRINIAHIINATHFELIEHDIVQPIVLDSIDEIYHLACPASPIHYQKDPIRTMKISFLGSLNALGIAKRCNAKILLSSTSEVYGDPSIHPQPESYWGNVNPIGIRSCYDEGKRCAETLFMDYYRKENIKIKIVRIFNTYGPRMAPHDGRVMTNLIMQALNNENLTIYGDGSQTRSFQYIDDLVSGLIKMMDKDDGFIGPVNLGNPKEHTINELAFKIIKQTNSKSKIVYEQLPSDDPRQRKPNINLAKEKLGWEPTVNLEKGLENMVTFLRDNLKLKKVV